MDKRCHLITFKKSLILLYELFFDFFFKYRQKKYNLMNRKNVGTGNMISNTALSRQFQAFKALLDDVLFRTTDASFPLFAHRHLIGLLTWTFHLQNNSKTIFLWLTRRIMRIKWEVQRWTTASAGKDVKKWSPFYIACGIQRGSITLQNSFSSSSKS